MTPLIPLTKQGEGATDSAFAYETRLTTFCSVDCVWETKLLGLKRESSRGQNPWFRRHRPLRNQDPSSYWFMTTLNWFTMGFVLNSFQSQTIRGEVILKMMVLLIIIDTKIDDKTWSSLGHGYILIDKR